MGPIVDLHYQLEPHGLLVISDRTLSHRWESCAVKQTRYVIA